jgi:peroxiredoxin Q/BCP
MCDSYGVLSAFGYAKRWTFYIDIDGIILKIDKDVSPSSAGKDLVMNLKELDFPKKNVNL